MSTDPTAITTEIPVTADMPVVATEPVGPAGLAVPVPATPTGALAAPGSAPGAGGPTAAGVEPCPHCGTSLALDQRYCLECGAPRTYLSGMLLERLRAPSAQDAPNQLQPPPPGAGVGAGAGGAGGVLPPSSSPGWQRGNVLTLIAGVGVLLLAMGVGVLIGRSGGSSASDSPAPQVISVGGAATGAASTSTTPTTPEATSTVKGGSGSSAAKQKSKAASSGVGSSPSKPAPPTVLKNERGGSGQSFEQKSKNLPNVVSTG